MCYYLSAMKDEENSRLVSWKEIAAYLGCDVRTCLRWEKERGLPVHRPGGKPGPRVMAWKKELDEWLGGGAHGAAEVEPARETTTALDARGSISRTWILIPAMLIIVGGLAFLGIRALTIDREPADFRIEGSRLIIQNKEKKDLWDFDTKLKNLWTEEDYRRRFQTRSIDKENGLLYAPCLIIEDIDGDGHAEVLFAPHAEQLRNSNRIYCFDRRGKERWHFDGGGEMVFGPKTYSGDYFVSFEIHDIDNDGRKEIFVIAEHLDDFPTQLTLLSQDRRLLGQYWHCGRITDLALEDLYGNGRPELLLGGVDNESEKAFFAVLDPRILAGQSPSLKKRCPTLPAGTEKAYILLPYTDLDPYDDAHGVLASLRRLGNGRIDVRTSKTQMIYELDPKTLACLDLVFSSTFRSLHEKA
ncbi:MAG: FG-GAP-like repeat-containing protein, partial [Candidatus Aminicenantes bacterium]|nr:FG-GAP-like repeat-containing protein [Candidatus Aminicenantes bacterium]